MGTSRIEQERPIFQNRAKKVLFSATGGAIAFAAAFSGCGGSNSADNFRPTAPETASATATVEPALNPTQINIKILQAFDSNKAPIPPGLCFPEQIVREIDVSYMLSNIPNADPISWTNGYGVAASEIQKIFDATGNPDFEKIIFNLEERTVADLKNSGVYSDTLVGNWEANWLNKNNLHYNATSCELN